MYLPRKIVLFRVDNIMFNILEWIIYLCLIDTGIDYVQRKLVPHGKQYQSTLIPVVASTPHGPANFMSLGRIVVDS